MYQSNCIDLFASLFLVDDEHVCESSFCRTGSEILEGEISTSTGSKSRAWEHVEEVGSKGVSWAG